MTIVYSADRRLYPYLGGIITSAITNCPQLKKIYILTKEPTCKMALSLNDSRVEIKDFSTIENYLTPLKLNIYESAWGVMTLARLTLSNILLEDKVLYLDCDTLVRKDLRDLWDIDLTNQCFAGAKEWGKSKEDFTYINTGVLLMNLERMREKDISSKLLNFLTNYKLSFPDQDAINRLCQDEIKLIDPTYNSCYYTKEIEDPHITHGTPCKPWYPSNSYHKDYLLYTKFNTFPEGSLYVKL